MPDDFDILEGETCPFCNEETLTLSETSRDIPYFGICHIFSMNCSNCKYRTSDVEAEEHDDPVKYTYEIDGEDDMDVRVVKSSECTVKVPYVGEIESGEASNGYITNIEGILTRLKDQAEHLRDSADDKADRKKAKNVVKKLQNIMWGREKAKLILEDPTGNSAIIHKDAKKEKL